VAMVEDAEPSARNLRFALEEDDQGNCEGQPLDQRSSHFLYTRFLGYPG
jgi:hypothetical protein